jgi:hypothetical protein
MMDVTMYIFVYSGMCAMVLPWTVFVSFCCYGSMDDLEIDSLSVCLENEFTDVLSVEYCKVMTVKYECR